MTNFIFLRKVFVPMMGFGKAGKGKCVRGDETNLFVKGTGEITNQTNEIGKYNL